MPVTVDPVDKIGLTRASRRLYPSGGGRLADGRAVLRTVRIRPVVRVR